MHRLNTLQTGACPLSLALCKRAHTPTDGQGRKIGLLSSYKKKVTNAKPLVKSIFFSLSKHRGPPKGNNSPLYSPRAGLVALVSRENSYLDALCGVFLVLTLLYIWSLAAHITRLLFLLHGGYGRVPCTVLYRGASGSALAFRV